MPDTSMKDVVAQMARSVAGIWMVTLVDSDCMVLASWQSPDNKVSPESLGGFIQIFTNTMNIFKQQTPVGFTRFDDIIFSTTVLHQMIKPIADANCFIVVSAPRSVPLGMIRTAIANYAPKLEQTLPGREPSPRKDGIGTVIP